MGESARHADALQALLTCRARWPGGHRRLGRPAGITSEHHRHDQPRLWLTTSPRVAGEVHRHLAAAARNRKEELQWALILSQLTSTQLAVFDGAPIHGKSPSPTPPKTHRPFDCVAEKYEFIVTPRRWCWTAWKRHGVPGHWFPHAIVSGRPALRPTPSADLLKINDDMWRLRTSPERARLQRGRDRPFISLQLGIPPISTMGHGGRAAAH